MSAFLLMILTACVGSGTKIKPEALPSLSGEFSRCFNREVPAPNAGAMTKRQVITLIGALKKSEKAKSLCGKRLITFYDRLQKSHK